VIKLRGLPILILTFFLPQAQGALVSSLPAGTVDAMPTVNYFGLGPQTFSNIVWTSTLENDVFGYSGSDAFGSNGTWTGSQETWQPRTAAL
jgi:hypothetical protein